MLAGLLKLATVSKIASTSLKRQVRQIALTFALALAGTFAALLALGIALRAFYLWLELSLGTFPALGIVGSFAALLAIIFFMLAFTRGRRRVRAAPMAPIASPAPVVPLAQTGASLGGAADQMARNASRQQLVGAALVAVLAGWILGKRM
jgi:hypothetical protein